MKRGTSGTGGPGPRGVGRTISTAPAWTRSSGDETSTTSGWNARNPASVTPSGASRWGQSQDWSSGGVPVSSAQQGGGSTGLGAQEPRTGQSGQAQVASGAA